MDPLTIFNLIAITWIIVTFTIAWRLRFRWWGYLGMFVVASVLTRMTTELLW